MPPTTTERIEQEADLFAGGNYTHNHFPVNYQNRHAGYTVGATSEANRSKVLVEALQTILGDTPYHEREYWDWIKGVRELASIALNEYNK